VTSRSSVPRDEISATEPNAGGVSYVNVISFPFGDQSGKRASLFRCVICVIPDRH
jgi:hypothetical protein